MSLTPPNLRLNPLQEQVIAALMAGHVYLAIRAGWGSGKTAALVLAVMYRAALYPGEAMVIITDTSSRYERVLGPEMAKWLGPLGWRYYAGRNITGKWVAPDGTQVWVVPYIRASTKASGHNPLEGMNVGAVFIDECQTLQPEVAVKAWGRTRGAKSPLLMMVGLPVASAWWVRYAEERDGKVLMATSFANKENLGKKWLDEVKNMPIAEREAMVMNRPQPPEGQVYKEWEPRPYPEGNLAPNGWTYDPDMETRVAGDWGLIKPWVGFIAYDPRLEADVLVAELNPREATLPEIVRLILTVAWPRHWVERMPQDGRPRFLLDGGSGDKAGRQRNDQTLRSTFDVLAQPPPTLRLPTGEATEACGIGLHLLSTSSPLRVNLANGILRTRSRIMSRQLLCEQRVWADGLSGEHDRLLHNLGVKSSGNSFARAITDYHYPESGGREEPVETSLEDPMDGLRYDTMNFRWDGVVGALRAAPPKAAPDPLRALTTGGGHIGWRSRKVGR